MNGYERLLQAVGLFGAGRAKNRQPYFRELNREEDDRLLRLAEQLIGQYTELLPSVDIKLICFCHPTHGGEAIILVPQVVSDVNRLSDQQKAYVTNLLIQSIRNQYGGRWFPSRGEGEGLMSRTYRRVPHWAEPNEPLSRHERSRSSKFPEVGRFYRRLKAGLVKLWNADDAFDRDRVRVREARAERVDRRLEEE